MISVHKENKIIKENENNEKKCQVKKLKFVDKDLK